MSHDSELFDDVAAVVVSVGDDEVARRAAAAGDDMAATAGRLRARFFARMAAAKAHAPTLTPSQHGSRSTGLENTLEDAAVDIQDIPPTIGRYKILGCLGVGGMGVVYSAHDEALDRKLAIKVLHSHVWDTSGRRRERLLREAQAMAKVTHPHLVTVHEVGTEDGQLFVAMEFVPGPSLERWLVTEVRSWQQVVVVFRQIAEGLAALHDAGLVHRDVKPANIIVGDDGRVRMLDLGLVGVDRSEFLETEDIKSAWSSSLSRVDQLLTKTGDRLGTPAYMSPEQFLRRELTPASDTFSFSITLYEALHGTHPYLADTFEQLRQNVLSGRVPTPTSSSVPSWLHAIVVRGLAPIAADRPNMSDLVAALSKDRKQSRRRWASGIIMLAAAAGFGTTWFSPSNSPQCDLGETTIAAVWDDGQARRVASSMAQTGLPYAEPLAVRLIATLDDYASSWAATHRQICLAHAAGENSSTLLDARMACLDRRRQALTATVALLTNADPGVVEHAGDMVAKLPRIHACNDLVDLNTRVTRTNSRLANTSERLQEQLVHSEVLANAGRIDEARELAHMVAAEAELLALPELLTDALLLEARSLLVFQHDLKVTGTLLDRALATAIEHSFDGPAAEAMIRRLHVRGVDPGGAKAALADIPIAEAMLLRAGDDLEIRALLLNNIGTVHLAAGDRPAARQAFEHSVAIREQLVGNDHLELALNLTNL
jgi:serine/threonine protein kinase